MIKRLSLACLIPILILMAIVAILILDIGGWGTFVLDIAKAVAVQTIVAVIVVGIALAVLAIAEKAAVFSLPEPVVRAILALAPLLALPALPIVFKRPIDVYDGIQTLVLVLVFYRVARRYKGRRVRAVRKRPVSRRGASIFQRPRSSAGSSASLEGQRYQKLLRMAMGDEEKVERLITYERRHAPRASRAELLERAIVRWERDIR